MQTCMYLCIILIKFKQKFLDKSDDKITYFSRCGICAAWSFNALEETCTLHTTDACCGQLDKRRANSDFVSGYICPQCSSTRNDCPCPRRIRQLGTLGCHIAQSAGKSPIYEPSSVSLTNQAWQFSTFQIFSSVRSTSSKNDFWSSKRWDFAQIVEIEGFGVFGDLNIRYLIWDLRSEI